MSQPARHLDDEQLSALVDEQVASAEAATADAHLRECALCAERAEELRSISVLLRQLPPLDPLRDFTIGPRLLGQSAPAYARLERWYARARIAASAMAALVVLLVGASLLLPTAERPSTALQAQSARIASDQARTQAVPASGNAPAPQAGATASEGAPAAGAAKPAAPAAAGQAAPPPQAPAAAAQPRAASGASAPLAPAPTTAPPATQPAPAVPTATAPAVSPATPARPSASPTQSPVTVTSDVASALRLAALALLVATGLTVAGAFVLRRRLAAARRAFTSSEVPHRDT